MFSRRRMKWVALGCLTVLFAAIAVQAVPSLSLWLKDLLYYVATGSAATGVALVLSLAATA